VTVLREELERVVRDLLARPSPHGTITLDEVGDAIGHCAVSQAEIEAIILRLEAAGRKITSPEGGHGETTLRAVLEAARSIRAETGQRPTARQIADKTGLAMDQVRHALALARVIGR
jgi:hypothetical protein